MFINRAFVAAAAVCWLVTVPVMAQESPKGVTLRLIEKGFDAPVQFLHDPAGRNFVVEQKGRVYQLIDGRKAAKPFIDIHDHVYMQGECGLLSIEFHPKFAENGRIFCNYTTKNPKLHTVVSEFKADPKADVVDATTEKQVLTFDQPQGNHNGGLVLFGPDGYLYIGTGDGGSGGDNGSGHAEIGNGQSLQTLLGKILRIDVDQASDGKAYGIPKDNPGVDGTLKCLPEIYAYGLRNPWRFSFDRKTGTLFAGDVGQGEWEEVDIIVKAGNYGWRIREGFHSFDKKKQSPVTPTIDPIAEYNHKGGGLSITGGHVYRGKAFPELQGVYLYGDYNSGRMWGLRYENGKTLWKAEIPVTYRDRTGPNSFSPSSFGENADGEIYACDYGRGQIFQITVTK